VSVRARRGLGVCLFYTIAVVYFTWPLAVNFRTHAVSHFDPPFSAWRLAWVSHQLVRAPGELFDANIFWPAKGTLAFSDAMLLQGVLALPLIRAGVTPLAVMNLFTLLGIVTSAGGAYLLTRRLTGHTWSAVLAGMIFAFGPFRHDHLQHLELQWGQWMPLALWAWHRTLDRGRFGDGLLCGLFVLLQLLSSIYYGLFLGLTLGVVGLMTLATRRFRIARGAVAGLATGVVILGLAATEYAKPYTEAQRALGDRKLDETRRYSANLASFVSTHPDNRLYGPITGTWSDEEKRLFPGVTPIVLAGAALVPPVSATAVIYGATTLFTADAARGLNGYVFTLLRQYVPAFRGFRAPARFGVMVQLGIGLLAALGLARLTRRWPQYTVWIVATSFVLVTIEYSVGAVALMPMPVETPRMYRWLAATQLPGTVVLEYPVPRAGRLPFEDPIYMYASTWHWRPLVNGYSGHYSPMYIELLNDMETFPYGNALPGMERAGVQILIVHKVLFHKGEYEKMIAQIEANPKFRLMTVADDWVTEARAYAFLPHYGRKTTTSYE
jgi:hypothetical protein